MFNYTSRKQHCINIVIRKQTAFNMIRIRILTITALLFSLFCSAQTDTLVFTPHWLPQAQFSGYYMADKMGFYADEGLIVNIEHPSASVMATEKLISGEADIISLFLVTAIDARDNGLDIVNIAQLSQHSALLFISKKSSQIETFDDLKGKKAGIWSSGFDEIPKMALVENQCTVDWVPILSTVNLFLIGGIDAMTVMWYNEYDQIINAGINVDEVNTIFLSDYGYDIPEDGIYCLQETFDSKQEQLRKFVKATQKGWEYACSNREQTLDTLIALMKKEHVPTNRAHQSWMLDRICELIIPNDTGVRGELTHEKYDHTIRLLQKGEYIRRDIPYDEFYKPLISK